MLEELAKSVHEQITFGHGGIAELEPLFTESEISKIVPIRNTMYARSWLQNVGAARQRDQLRRGTPNELGQMRAFMRAFLRTH